MLSPEEFRKKYPKKYYSDYESFLNIYGLITDENTAIEKINKHWNSNIYRTLNQQYKDDYINANIETFRNFKNQFIEDAKAYDKFDAIDDLIKHTNDIDYARQLIKDATSPEEYDEVINFFNNNTGLFENNWKTSKDKSNKNYRSEPPPEDNGANNRNTSKKKKKTKKERKQEEYQKRQEQKKQREEQKKQEQENRRKKREHNNQEKQEQKVEDNNKKEQKQKIEESKKEQATNNEKPKVDNTNSNNQDNPYKDGYWREKAKKTKSEAWEKQYEKFKKEQAGEEPTPKPFWEQSDRDIPIDEKIKNDIGFDTKVAHKRKTIEDVIGDASTIEEAQARLSKYGKANHLDPSELKGFLKHNKDLFGFDDEGARIIKEATEEVTEDLATGNSSLLGKIFNAKTVGIGLSAWTGISEYKNSRNEGNGVVKSGVKAVGSFAISEALGPAYFPIMLAKSAPKLAVSAVTGLQQMTRQMNSYQRIQTFGDAQFQDTQQIATMRQAGMELAKMSQYNLQQAIMGNEAQYMHRI